MFALIAALTRQASAAILSLFGELSPQELES